MFLEAIRYYTGVRLSLVQQRARLESLRSRCAIFCCRGGAFCLLWTAVLNVFFYFGENPPAPSFRVRRDKNHLCAERLVAGHVTGCGGTALRLLRLGLHLYFGLFG